MGKIRAVIADDNEEIRNYLSEVIQAAAEDIEVAGLASSGSEAVELAKKLKPDVILMDVQMESHTSGITAVEQIHRQFPDIKCIMLTIHENEEYMLRAYLAGAVDYIVKMSPTEKIVSSIYDVIDNKLLLRPEIAKKIMNEYQRLKENQRHVRETLQIMMMISTTEYEILRMVYNGDSYKKIAQKRFVQETTVRSQIHHILKKFKKKRMKDVIRLLRELNIFENDSGYQ